MSIVITTTTVSRRYYMRKSRSEIVQRLRDLRQALKSLEIWVAPTLDSFLAAPDAELRKLPRNRLADVAIRLHTYFPDDEQ